MSTPYNRRKEFKEGLLEAIEDMEIESREQREEDEASLLKFQEEVAETDLIDYTMRGQPSMLDWVFEWDTERWLD